MFGFGKRKSVPAGPVMFDFEVIIARPVEKVYPLIDWADPLNAKRQLGHEIEGDGNRFMLKMTSMPDLRFTLDVIEAEPNHVYAFACEIEPRVGRLERNCERYLFERTAEDHCLLRLLNEVQFVDGLTKSEHEHEMLVMSIATNDALMKLKILAEMGVEMAKAVEDKTFGLD